MTVVAGNILKSRIEQVLPFSCKLHPGRWSSSGEESFGTYEHIIGRDYEQPYVHVDSMVISIYHTRYMGLQDGVDALLNDLNVENTAGHQLNSSTLVRFLSISANAVALSQNTFIDDVEYFRSDIVIMFRHVELAKGSVVGAPSFILGV